jgi:hypothetical protein
MTFQMNLLAMLMTFCALLTACGGPTEADVLRAAAGSHPLELSSEQVSLSMEQVNCGVRNELWEEADSGTGGQTYRLTQKGRDLQFSDDILPIGPNYGAMYTQVRGKFALQMGRVDRIRTASDGSKLVQAQLGVRVPHECFAAALPLMAVAKGKFTPDVFPTLKYEAAGESFEPTELVH